MLADVLKSRSLLRVVKVGLVAAVGLAVVIATPSQATEAASEPVVWIEEDWGLVLNEPDDAVDSPQFHTIMSPTGTLDGTYLQATWNYWDQPAFGAGGLQLQAWQGDVATHQKGFFDGQQLSLDSEMVTWTQVMAITERGLLFGILNGESTTWGAFGGGTMYVTDYALGGNLSGYSPNVSVKNSWVTYGANRVNSLILKRIRYYGWSGLLFEDTTQRVVFEHGSN